MLLTRRLRPTKWRLGSAAYGGFALLLGLPLAPAWADPTTPEGIWYTKDEESIIKVHTCSESPSDFCGTIVWLKEPKDKDGSVKLDALNKDPAKRTKPLVGLEILLEMKADDDHWTGKAYNPDDGKTYDITFKVKTDKVENDSADLRGCVLGFLCQTETFTRANEVPGGDPTLADASTASTKKHRGSRKDAKKDPAPHH